MNSLDNAQRFLNANKKRISWPLRRDLKIWFPYTSANSGSTVLTRTLARKLTERGIQTVAQPYPHAFQYAPWLLQRTRPPAGTTAVVTNSWNGFAFHRPDLTSICIEHLFVLDDALSKYKSVPQAIFHDLLVARFLSQSYASAEHTVAVSQYTADQIQRRFPQISPKVILNGIDTDYFSPSPLGSQPKRADSKFRLLFAGNLTRRKGSDLLPKIMTRLGDGFELRFTGDKADLPYKRVSSNMKPLGRLTADEMRSQYRVCDALIAPTRLEGLSLVVLEAQACGLPVIASDSASLPEAVEQGVTGFVCGVDDVKAMVEAAQRLKTDSALHSAMRKAARERAVRNFKLSTMIDSYIQVITGSVGLPS